MDLLIDCYVYAVCDMFLADFVVDVVLVAIKCGFVLVDCIVYDVSKVQRFNVALDCNRHVVRNTGEFDSGMCWVLVGPKSVDLLYVRQHLRRGESVVAPRGAKFVVGSLAGWLSRLLLVVSPVGV